MVLRPDFESSGPTRKFCSFQTTRETWGTLRTEAEHLQFAAQRFLKRRQIRVDMHWLADLALNGFNGF